MKVYLDRSDLFCFGIQVASKASRHIISLLYIRFSSCSLSSVQNHLKYLTIAVPTHSRLSSLLMKVDPSAIFSNRPMSANS